MAKIYLDNKYIESRVLPSLEKAINNLVMLLDNVESLDIPENFEYSIYLKNLPDEISVNTEKLKEKKSELQTIIKGYINTENKNYVEIENIQNFSLSHRKK